MRGYLPSQSDDSKQPPRTSLLVRWQAIDHVLLDALRPFKARARGRRFKELATLGAELERRGFRLATADGGYRLLLPADMAAGLELRAPPRPGLEQALPAAAPVPPALSVTTVGAAPLTTPQALAASPSVALTPDVPGQVEAAPAGSVIPVVDDDTLEFAASFG